MNVDKLVLPSNRKFGYFFTSIFLIVTAYFGYIQAVYLCIIFACTSVVFLIITIVSPEYLKYLNISWMYIGYVIGSIISPLILGFIFYFIFSPISIFLKLAGRDELEINDIYKESSWKPRDSSFNHIDKFKKQF